LLYSSKEQILDEQLSSELTEKIRKKFTQYGNINLSLDQLQRIVNIIEEEK
jgi:hypothetical protein